MLRRGWHDAMEPAAGHCFMRSWKAYMLEFLCETTAELAFNGMDEINLAKTAPELKLLLLSVLGSVARRVATKDHSRAWRHLYVERAALPSTLSPSVPQACTRTAHPFPTKDTWHLTWSWTSPRTTTCGDSEDEVPRSKTRSLSLRSQTSPFPRGVLRRARQHSASGWPSSSYLETHQPVTWPKPHRERTVPIVQNMTTVCNVAPPFRGKRGTIPPLLQDSTRHPMDHSSCNVPSTLSSTLHYSLRFIT